MVNVGRNALGGGGDTKSDTIITLQPKSLALLRNRKKTQRIFKLCASYIYRTSLNLEHLTNFERWENQCGKFRPVRASKAFFLLQLPKGKATLLRRKGQSFAGSRREWKGRRENWSQRKEGRRSFTVSLPFSPAAREFSVPPSFSQQSETEREKKC